MKLKTKLRIILPIVILNIILPTIDIATDLRVIIELFLFGTKRTMIAGSAMFVPFLLNYLMGFHTWFRLEKEKAKTFIFPFLDMFPQLCEYKF